MQLKNVAMFGIGIVLHGSSYAITKPHELWWQTCLDTTCSMQEFAQWLGTIQAPSRVAMRTYIRTKSYTSILDVACGLGTDYVGLMHDQITINYQGLDVTEKLVQLGTTNNIPIACGSVEQIPYNDNTFDICYGRHILEHLDYYERALAEMIRIACKEVLVIFFLNPHQDNDLIRVDPNFRGSPVHHNIYNISKLESYIRRNTKVHHLSWEYIGDNESMLHIYLK